MHKGKVLTVSFRVKSSKQLASHLGLSKARTDRIAAIVEKFSPGKMPAPITSRVSRGTKGRVAVNIQNSRTGRRSNATGAKAAKAAR
jgi:hypothetical protein